MFCTFHTTREKKFRIFFYGTLFAHFFLNDLKHYMFQLNIVIRLLMLQSKKNSLEQNLFIINRHIKKKSFNEAKEICLELLKKIS